jgi:hypothetical protein
MKPNPSLLEVNVRRENCAPTFGANVCGIGMEIAGVLGRVSDDDM